MDQTTQQGIAALKRGDKVRARELLIEAAKQHPDDVQAWLDRLLKLPSTSDPDAVSALLQIARLTGDRDRDLPDETRQKVKMALLAKSVSPDRYWV